MTSSCHRCLGLPTGLVLLGFQSHNFLVGLVWSILCIWPSHLNLTLSTLPIYLSISMLFHILHILSILTVPNIFLSVFLSQMCRLFSSFAFKVQVSDEHVTTRLIIVLYIFILVFLFRNFNFISFALALRFVTIYYSFSNFCIYFIICIQNGTQIIIVILAQ